MGWDLDEGGSAFLYFLCQPIPFLFPLYTIYVPFCIAPFIKMFTSYEVNTIVVLNDLNTMR